MLLRSIARAVDAATAEAPDRRIVLVLDDVHVLRSAAAHETIAAIATELPAEITVALASRAEPAAPDRAAAGPGPRDPSCATATWP